jgi:hypothetical protein
VRQQFVHALVQLVARANQNEGRNTIHTNGNLMDDHGKA